MPLGICPACPGWPDFCGTEGRDIYPNVPPVPLQKNSHLNTRIGGCLPRHRAKEFLCFLRGIDRAVKKPRDVHLVLDNYATHKTPEVQAALEKHPRFMLHFTPTSASWLNMVERFFAQITSKPIRRCSYPANRP